MPIDRDLSGELAQRVQDAAGRGAALAVIGGGSKAFYGREPEGEPLEVSAHRGVVDYQRSELVLTARGGTSLAELEALLAEGGQMLGFEPPHFGPGATLGGAVAAGLSGPRRPYAGAARDLVLGVKLLNGKGEILTFGGQVMKNVAGYDISRLMAGAMGTLGILLEVSLKLLPAPARETTVVFDLALGEALERLATWGARPLPVSAACHDGGRLFLRLSGTEGSVASALAHLGGEEDPAHTALWPSLRDHTHPFFAGPEPLWRLSVPPATPPLALPGAWLVDWGGAQRWLRTDADAAAVRAAAQEAGGHATLFRRGDRRGEVFHPLPPPMMDLHRRLKRAFDPEHVLNPGRMYAEL